MVTFDLAGPPLAHPPTLQQKDSPPQHILLAIHHAWQEAQVPASGWDIHAVPRRAAEPQNA